MKLNPESQELLDRYFHAIRMELPVNQRNDIVAELESNLFDSLEERFPADVEIDQSTLKQFLVENGSPKQVARDFLGPRYLIGPGLYPFYTQVLRIVLTILSIVLIVVFLTGAFVNPPAAADLLPVTFTFIGDLWGAVLTSAAIVTLVFAVLERRAKSEIDSLQDESWNPDELPQISSNTAPKKSEHIIGIIGGIIWIMILIYLLNVGDIFSWINGQRILTATITDSFRSLLPFFITISGLELALHAVVLAQQSYSAFSRWFKIILEILNVILLGLVFQALPIFDFVWVGLPNELQQQAANLEPLIHKTFSGVILLVLVVTSISIIRRVYAEIIQRPA